MGPTELNGHQAFHLSSAVQGESEKEDAPLFLFVKLFERSG